jgi:uncharacterized membrane protein
MSTKIRLVLFVLFAQAFACLVVNLALELDPTLLAPRLVSNLAQAFAQGQILLSFVALAVILHAQCRWQWLPGFVVLYCGTLAAECMGTRFGIPFGSYAFTDMLGIKWFGLVPALIPLAWFNIAVPAFVVASLGFPGRAGRVVAGAALMLAWDLFADPLMGSRYAFWGWRDPGVYYGIPLSNFAGWFLVGLLAMTWIDGFSWSRIHGKCRTPFALHYAVSLLLALGLAVVFRMGLALATCSALLLALEVCRRIDRAPMHRVNEREQTPVTAARER